MDLTNQINALPKPPVGYVRAIRLESKDDPRIGAQDLSYMPWGDLPTPYEECMHSMRHDDVCAAHPHTFHKWFKPGFVDEVVNSTHHIVALDVPLEAAKVMPMQLVIMRHLAKQVAVLLQ